MNTLQLIRKDNLALRKSKITVKANLTTTLIGEITTQIKGNLLKGNLTEEDITIASLKKMHKSIASFPSNTQEEELDLLTTYLPKMMTLEAIQDYIESNYDLTKVPNKIALTGVIMKNLKGKANGKDVSTVLKSL